MDIGQLVVSGILLGGVYGLLSMGLTMIFGVVKIINFAHGEFLMLSMYLTYFIVTLLNWNPYPSMLIIIPIAFIFGCLVMKGLLKIINTSSVTKMLVMIGLSMTLQNLALLFWTADSRSISSSFKTATLNLFGTSVSIVRLIAFAICITVSVLVFLFLKRTRMGKAIRATSQDKRTASLMGIDISKIYLFAFGLGTVMTAIAGTAIMPIYSTSPIIGTYFSNISFVVVVMGGLGNLMGALVAGIIIGLVENLSILFINPALKEVVYFVIFLIVLIVKPAGLFGQDKNNAVVGLE